MKRKIIIIILLILCILIIFVLRKKENMSNNQINDNPLNISNTNDFDIKMIKETNNSYNNKNYMISPLSIAYALSLAKDGAQDETKNQIDNLIGNYKLNNSINIKDKISIANLLFAKDKYKKDISKDYIDSIQKKYDSDLLFDKFNKPDVVNNWISKKTFNMLNNVISSISEDFVLGLANAIAIDVEWESKFECDRTSEQDFTKIDNTKMKTAMMHSSNDATYIESNNAKGIIKNYAIYDKNTGQRVYDENENTVSLEYIAIIPNNDINDYINKFDKNELNNLLNNKKTYNQDRDIYISLPKYTYDFTYDNLKNSLINLGVKDAFNVKSANFKKMLDENSELSIFISDVIHKTHIELSENGTKAAAVTVFMMDGAAAYEKPRERISITFDKPFIYLIKEKNSNNIWFFGTVFEPLKWEEHKSTCKYE